MFLYIDNIQLLIAIFSTEKYKYVIIDFAGARYNGYNLQHDIVSASKRNAMNTTSILPNNWRGKITLNIVPWSGRFRLRHVRLPMLLCPVDASIYGNWYIWNNEFTLQWRTTNVLYIFYSFIILVPSNNISLVFTIEHLWPGAWNQCGWTIECVCMLWKMRSDTSQPFVNP